MVTKTEVEEIAVSVGTQALAKRHGAISVEEAARVVLTAAIASGAVRFYDADEE